MLRRGEAKRVDSTDEAEDVIVRHSGLVEGRDEGAVVLLVVLGELDARGEEVGDDALDVGKSDEGVERCDR